LLGKIDETKLSKVKGSYLKEIFEKESENSEFREINF
jgi:hypothetical protein